MISFSVIVTSYNKAAYLSDCLQSVANQTYPFWNCLVVNDASSDETGDIAHQFASRDDRFSVLDLQVNQGLHLARKNGVAVCQDADYALFLDADDELAIDALECFQRILIDHPVDSLHFGIDVISCGIMPGKAEAFEDYVNAPCEFLDGKSLCEAIFTERGGYRKDWRVTQRVYRSDVLKKSFLKMTEQRLDRAEDCYEVLVLADHIEGEFTANDIRGLKYFYGRGVTGTSQIEIGVFQKFVDQFQECIVAMEDYARMSLPGRDIQSYVEGAKPKLLDLLMNDWSIRVTESEQGRAARYAAKVIGDEPIACQLMRLTRDEAYSDWLDGVLVTGHERYFSWFRLAEDLVREEKPADRSAYFEMRLEARDHIADLEKRSVWVSDGATSTFPIKASSYEKQDIRIFVTTHKDVDIFYSDILQPVQVGPALHRHRLMWAYQDDSGDNIANLNPMYCELTTQYWAWKNVKARYYGFCHYRRYFDFSNERHAENPYGEIIDDKIGWRTQCIYHMDDDSITAAVEGCDVVTTGVNDFSRFPEAYTTPLDLYRRSPYLHEEDLERILEILNMRHPDYREDAQEYMSGSVSCFCNMFIMRRDLFFQYCEWLFPLLEEFVAGWDTSRLSHESLRTPGHLSERLLNVFLIHERRVNPQLVWKTLQCVHFEHPEHLGEPCLKALPVGETPVIPVVFSADNSYVPMLTTTICSMLENASSAYRYDIVVMERDISFSNKESMQKFVARYCNAQLRFINVTGFVQSYQLQTNNPHISNETYYRFLIQRILPEYDKVIYLDADVIVQGDISQLFKTALEDNLIAAAPDIDFIGNLDIKGVNRLSYAQNVLHLDNPYGYFQAGVLVLNTAEMRKFHSLDEWLDLASCSTYLYDDQDILNSECQGRVVYLDNAWNVMVNCDNRFKKVFSFAPADTYDDFMRAYANPKIVHYAGYEKPWKPGPCDMRELYWSYARMTPFYEELLSMIYANHREVGDEIALVREELRRVRREIEQAKRDVVVQLTTHERAISEDNPMREVMDVFLPFGSRRREILKSMARRVRGRR